jgi:putative chitinase
MFYDKLKNVIPDSRFAQLPMLVEKFNCNTPLRMAHFMAQAAHESSNFQTTVENLNYSADGLLRVFPKYFTSDIKIAALKQQSVSGKTEKERAEAKLKLPIEMKKKKAADYHRKPEMIANIVYANRMGNGPTESGDGWHHRGRGDLQTTGKDNYKAFGEFVGVDFCSNPSLLENEYSLQSAGFFFHTNKLWPICDKGATKDVVKQVRLKVNGGTIGLDDVYAKFVKYYNLLNGTI